MAIGANVIVNSTTFFAGNSTVNSTTTSSLMRVANSSASANVSTAGFAIGIFTANATAVSVGANVIVTSTTFFAGNTTANSTTNSTSFYVSNTSSTLSAVADTLSVGNTSVNTVINSVSGVFQGATPQVRVSNTTSNSVLTTIGLTIGNSSVTSTLAASNLAISDHTIDVTSNGNIGSSTTTPILIYSFPKASYSSGKIMAQLKNTGNTQISEMVVAHDLTSAYISVYGTVSSPPSATTDASRLGIFSASINNANVEIYVKQVITSTAVKVVANLIK